MTYFVTALDGPRTFFLAGPYLSKTAAEAKVSEAREIACDFGRNSQAGRAHFMAYGVSRWKTPEAAPKSALGTI